MPTKKSSSGHTPLQRGLACLSCRKRKLKCDGQKPVCTPCIKMKRADECEYEDRRQKSRTQKLKEKLAMLEDRIKELEGTEQTTSGDASSSHSGSPDTFDLSGTNTLDDVDQNQISLNNAWPANSAEPSSNSSSSSLLSASGSPFASAMGMVWGDTSGGGEQAFEISPFTGMSSSMFPDMPHWDPTTPLPFENKKILLELFIAHRHQCWFFSDTTRLDILSNGESIVGVPEPHPALMNALYLLACHFSRSPYFSELESTFLTRALREITVALDNQDRLVDVVQASSLLAIYFYANSRILEGYCHSFSAARLAVGLGLHQIQFTDLARPSSSSSAERSSPTGVMNLTATGSPSSIASSPPKDHSELRERISTFWQVFMVDRCWSVANGLPVALPDGEHHQGRIKTPWPDAALDDVVTTTGVFDPLGNPVYMPSLKAKAAALYERTFRLSSSVQPNWAELAATSNALQRFLTSLPLFLGFEPWRNQAPFLDVELLTIHTVANVCTIHINKNNLEMENLQAANYVLTLIRQLGQTDYEWLDPLISACWMTVAKLYLQILSLSGSAVANALPVFSVDQELDVLVDAMKTLSAFFPLAGEHARRIEQERALILSSI
ncbi:uncharacterized protein C8R40DRAFT_1166235 [Lentinula edodes]|uniref:uncharacterized protein n=1 Tax=Lentinula edodes TaxID=5353 RepID=UPI001E8E0A5F|nr:uncharacterized protein C8R40DRAFT_1166235 [Lentinula edodes]KAH7880030.1 hypothetical protein C8R40DRAFT_1166235 [Lentinula edodes]